MRILLLILGLDLSYIFRGQTTAAEEDFDMNKLSGRWYPFLLTSTYMGWTNQDFGVLIYKISVTVDDLIITFSVRDIKECVKMKIAAFRMETNRYKFKYPGRHEFHVEDADSEDFLLISTINEFDIKILGVELYSRRKDGTLNEIAKSKFHQLCRFYGLANGSFIDLTTADRCFLDEKHAN